MNSFPKQIIATGIIKFVISIKSQNPLVAIPPFWEYDTTNPVEKEAKVCRLLEGHEPAFTNFQAMSLSVKKNRGKPPLFSQYNTDQTAAPLVYNPLQGLLELQPRVHRHTVELRLQVFIDQLVEAAAKNIGLPDLRGVAAEFVHQIVDHILALLLIADNARYG